MKTFLSLLLLISATSFSQPDKTDPYYVKSYDTISQRGPNCIVRHIKEDNNGNMWFASWSGIIKYDGKYFTNYTLKDSLIPFHVFSIMKEKNGNLWFGTVRGGAYRYDGKSFTLFTSENGLPDDLIDCMMEDKNGRIWIGTDGGMSIYDPAVEISQAVSPSSALTSSSKQVFINYRYAEGLLNEQTNSVIQDKTGKIWVATRGGVYNCDASAALAKANKPFTMFNIKAGVPFTNVRCLLEDKNGKIWIGGADGLYRYNPEIKGDSALTRFMLNFIGYIYQDKSGNFWISAGESFGMSLYKFDGKTLTKMIEKNTNGDQQVFEITEDKDGNIWFGTMQGPIRYDGKTFTSFNNYIYKK